jgi:uncharacterized hydrophobic protein (TIGR00271 family)
MRLLIIRTAQGCGERALAAAGERGGVNLAMMAGRGPQDAADIVLAHVPNDAVEGLLADLQALPDLHLTLLPMGVLALRPPSGSAPDEVADVGARSPIEIFLGGLQSVGSWRGFLSYAAAAGVVVWVGLFTDTVYLLTAAMLIAPFAGPAMNAALATARGDAMLLARSVGRYFAALAVTICVAGLLSIVFFQDVATSLMLERSQLSSAAVLLPIAAGAAGALNLCQSDRSSLVSGAATGMLVAASLAPPAGLVGMAMAIREWDLVASGAFVLVLQLVAINLSGAIVFFLFGLRPQGVRFGRGRAWAGASAAALSAAGLVFLIVVQASDTPALQRSSIAQRATGAVEQAVRDSGLATPILVDVRFTRPDAPGREVLLVRLYAEGADDERTKQALARQVRSFLRARFDVAPLIEVTLLQR